MTTNEIADIIISDLVRRSFSVFLTTFQGVGLWEMDVLGINESEYIYEFEIKRSKEDYLSEFKNKALKHQFLSQRESTRLYDKWKDGKRTEEKVEYITIPNRYFFVCEEGLIKPEEVPEYAGLLYVVKKKYSTIDREELVEIKKAKLLHKNKANLNIYKRVAIVLSQRIVYGCSFYTYKHKLKL